LDDEVGGLPHAGDGLTEQAEIEGGSVLGVAAVNVDERGARCLAPDGGLDEFLGGGRQLRQVALEVLGPGGGNRDEGAGRRAQGHDSMVPDKADRA
jgi:hypothetical protein